MAEINKTHVSDPPLDQPMAQIRKGADGEYYSNIVLSFDKGKVAVPKRVLLADLAPADKAAGLQFYNALHAKGLTLVTADDF